MAEEVADAVFVLLGFGAFPGTADGGETTPLRIAPAPAGVPALAPARIVVASARRPAARRAVGRPARNRAVRGPRRHRGLPAAPPRGPAHGAGAAPPTVPAPVDRGPATSAAAPSPPERDAGPLAPAAQATRDTGGSAAGALEPAVPPAVRPVEAAGTAVAGAVEQADHTVAATLGAVGR